MFKRMISTHLLEVTSQFPAATLTGPRQSGKTTLLRSLFPQMAYCLLESPDVLARVRSDPRGYIEEHMDEGIIFDEAQNLPEIFSYLQEYIDQNQKAGQFILSGSQNFLLMEKVSQTLAGRTAILELLPLTYQEFLTAKEKSSVWEYLYNGSYPRPYNENIDHRLWYQSYVATYIERDVRQMINIRDASKFHRFLKLCAGRHAQLLNLDALATDAGISKSTADMWLSLLERSYILYRLRPYYKNFKKRLVKMPKLYFFDSGLVSYLLEIDSFKHLSMHSARGAIFEGFIITEIMKFFYNRLKIPNIFFWRDYRGDELDIIVEYGEQLLAIEVKSSQTITDDLFKNLYRWQKVSDHLGCSNLVYAGANQQETRDGIQILNWENIPKLFDYDE